MGQNVTGDARTFSDESTGSRPPSHLQVVAGPPDPDPATTFWRAVATYREGMFRHSLILMNGHPADAEDALSAALVRAEQAYRRGESKIVNPRAWLHRVLHNVCIDIHRERARWEQRIEEMGAMAASRDWHMTTPDPERALLDLELSEEVLANLDELPNQLREVVILRAALGLPYSDIANRLGITDANARKRMQLARSRLRHMFGDAIAVGASTATVLTSRAQKNS